MGRFKSIISILGSLIVVLGLSTRAALSTADARSSGALQPTPFSIQFIGMHTLSPTRHWPTVPVGSMRPAGVTWAAIEPRKGQFNWQGLDTWVAQAQAHGAQLDYNFLNTPQWASSRPTEHCSRGAVGCAAPPTAADWDDFIRALVTRYKGKITSYELWNEPNAPGYWTGSEADMVKAAAQAYRIIKSIDPQAIVLSPAPSSTGWPKPYQSAHAWMDRYLKAGGGKYADAIAWHGYAGYSNRPATPPEDLVNQIARIRAAMAKDGVGNLPLWDTEGGWGKDTQLPDPTEQEAFVARWYLIQFTHGVARAYWYQWDNPEWGTLWREGTGPTPAGLAVGQIYNWLNGVTASSACGPATGAIWSCDLMKGSTRTRVVWSTSGTGSYTDLENFTAYSDLSGNRHPIVGKSVAVSGLPILLEGKQPAKSAAK